jgi:hypothetical protein
MKKYVLLGMLTASIAVYSNAQSTDDVKITITENDKRVEATAICLDAIEAPTKYNEFAKQFITLPNFPIKKNSVTSENYKKEVDQWLVTNPFLIDKILTERKKAHDILYGTRPY